MPNSNEKIISLMDLLEANKNLILHGAPGTGKTHLAKDIAKAMGCTDDEIGFVQFHPSYDYTDFVEGLRPDPDNDESKDVSFIRMDGVFKEFCKRALKANFSDGVDNFDEVWEKLVEYLNENDFIDVQSIKFGKVFNISLNATGTGLMCPDRSGFYFSKEQLYKVYRGEKGIPSGAFDNVRKAIIKKMHSDFDLEDYKVGTETNEKKNFVFIIDEINRGEISKIFGELFFSIDPGYRGEKGRVLTQYQNLVTEYDEHGNEDPFTKDKGGFFVPENVYIIGTMNDIDRSVESMDFAFRRRFAFCEIMASENVGMLDALDDDNLKKEAINRMNNLNNAIEKIEGLSSAYHIGASYFLKLQNYDGDFDGLWKYHIEGLLREYLRGNPEIETLIGDLKSAYDNENQIAEKQDAKNQVEETE